MDRFIVVTFTIFCICGHAGFGQALTNNNALITISPDTRVTVLGGALNNGDLSNEGTLSVSGDWMNVDTYVPGNGLMIFDGSDNQSIVHNGGLIFRMRIEGGGQKSISGTLEIQDTLEFVDGHVSVPDGSILLVHSNGGIIGGSDQSYVEGTLYHQGTGNKYYPVGTDGNYRPVELLNITGTDPVVGLAVVEPNSEPTIPLQLLTVSDTRYWQLSQMSGTYGGSQIRLKLGPDENLITDVDPSDLVVAGTDSIGGIFLSLGQSSFSGTISDGELTSSLPANNDYYAIAVEGFAEERALFVPNALSPSAPDPEDQVVKVYGQQIADEGFSFQIFNRWGQLVYETTSFSEANTVGWNGESANQDLESIGVYQYTLIGRFVSGRPFKRQGSINVIR